MLVVPDSSSKAQPKTKVKKGCKSDVSATSSDNGAESLTIVEVSVEADGEASASSAPDTSGTKAGSGEVKEGKEAHPPAGMPATALSQLPRSCWSRK